MYIIAIGWMYVVLMMSITERSVVAGIMTFLLYGIAPLAIILYVLGTPQRRRNRKEAEKRRKDFAEQSEKTPMESVPESDAHPKI